ncbi:outer membrane protein with beta-barrel domain [Neolewinella xylanilytica]|uniref:Outer membrane protein with beta-barrel domain n=1 Tax=Neolewinella xylanilytica TaxID=1514080 RepID=A0A2S6I326_9BACT|nr:porin family protein [Neolewinella xylanilytica]PPK85577.1 outer membrane protein with beta-barrel domain [Neolewinella xylanilytica]
MYKKLTLLFGAFLLSVCVSAQLGIKAGVTLGGTYGSSEEFNGDKIESIDPAVGYQFGITAQVVDLPLFKLNAELLYENRRGQKHANFTIPASEQVSVNTDIRFRNSFEYLSLPLLATFGGDKFNIYVGPSFSYLLAASSDVTTRTTVSPAQAAGSGGLPSNATAETEIDFIEDYEDSYINRFNVAANVGVMFPILPRTSLDIRVYHTLTDITNDDEDRSIIDRAIGNPDPGLRDDNDSSVGVQANLVFHF